jgi:nitrogen fixation/metabolism regulation signal transduction histidine kinase
LGLAIVKKIVEEHHGSIEVHNRTPHGAAVCLTLPIAGDRHE